MTQQSPSSRNRRIRQALKSPRVHALSPQLRLFAQAVWNIPDQRGAHARCHADLPSFVDAEIDGHLATWHGSFVHEHLQTCHRCSTDYAELLEIAILDSRGLMNQRSSSSSPNLSFLELPHD